MNCIQLRLIVLGFCLSQAGTSHAQFRTFFKQGSWGITVLAGVSGQQAMGTLPQNFKEQVRAMNDTAGANRHISGKVLPLVSYTAGIRFHKSLTAKIAAEAGLQLTQRGYHLREESNTSDPDYQLDEQTLQHVKVKATILEIPLAGLYSLSKKDQLELAIVLGIGIRSSVKTAVTYQNTVIINGKPDVQWSIPTQTGKPDFKSYLQSFTPGISAAYYRRLYKDLYAGAGVQYATKYFSTPDGNAGGLCLLVNLKYTFDPSAILKHF